MLRNLCFVVCFPPFLGLMKVEIQLLSRQMFSCSGKSCLLKIRQAVKDLHGFNVNHSTATLLLILINLLALLTAGKYQRILNYTWTDQTNNFQRVRVISIVCGNILFSSLLF